MVCDNKEELQSELENIAQEFRTLGEEQEDKRMNMPDHLQDVGSGETLEQYAQASEQYAEELEEIAGRCGDEDEEVEELLEEAQGLCLEV
jgi:flagellar biosynthesis chaperone FliJ